MRSSSRQTHRSLAEEELTGAIHRAAGPQLLAECRGLGGCATGDAKIHEGIPVAREACDPRRRARLARRRGGEPNFWRHATGVRWSCVLTTRCRRLRFLVSTGVYGFPLTRRPAAVATFARTWPTRRSRRHLLLLFGVGSGGLRAGAGLNSGSGHGCGNRRGMSLDLHVIPAFDDFAVGSASGRLSGRCHYRTFSSFSCQTPYFRRLRGRRPPAGER